MHLLHRMQDVMQHTFNTCITVRLPSWPISKHFFYPLWIPVAKPFRTASASTTSAESFLPPPSPPAATNSPTSLLSFSHPGEPSQSLPTNHSMLIPLLQSSRL
ncbi:hypothetical protein ACE6H2_006781 [Prunus campanulata]